MYAMVFWSEVQGSFKSYHAPMIIAECTFAFYIQICLIWLSCAGFSFERKGSFLKYVGIHSLRSLELLVPWESWRRLHLKGKNSMLLNLLSSKMCIVLLISGLLSSFRNLDKIFHDTLLWYQIAVDMRTQHYRWGIKYDRHMSRVADLFILKKKTACNSWNSCLSKGTRRSCSQCFCHVKV